MERSFVNFEDEVEIALHLIDEGDIEMIMTKQAEHQKYLQIRSTYGKSSKVPYSHIQHRMAGSVRETCEWCVKESRKSAAQLERQMTREHGRYAEYLECDLCGKKLSISKVTIDDDGAFLCGKCVNK